MHFFSSPLLSMPEVLFPHGGANVGKGRELHRRHLRTLISFPRESCKKGESQPKLISKSKTGFQVHTNPPRKRNCRRVSWNGTVQFKLKKIKCEQSSLVVGSFFVFNVFQNRQNELKFSPNKCTCLKAELVLTYAWF